MELGNGVTINFLEVAQNDLDLLQVAATEIAEAAQTEGITLAQFAGANAVAAAEAEPTETETEAETRDIHESPEATGRRERAARVITTLAEKFERPESDFSVVTRANKDGENISAVALTATERLDLGDPSKTYDSERSWNKVTAKDDDPRFIIEVDGQKIDTRDSQNIQWLRAVAAANPDIDELVWRAGEPEKADRDRAPIARLLAGQACPGQGDRSNVYRDIGFRPVVAIG